MRITGVSVGSTSIKEGPFTYKVTPELLDCEALGQLGQDEPASG